MELIAAIVILLLYFVPTVIASNRNHANVSAIFFLNLLLGWSVVGWVAALVWALSNPAAVPVVINQTLPAGTAQFETIGAMKTCPKCAEDVKSAATVCRYCGHVFTAS